MAIKKLNAKHLEIARLLMEFKSHREIARILGLSESHVSRVVHSPVFREYMNGLQDQLDEAASEKRTQRRWAAGAKNIADMKSPNRAVSFKAARKIMGLATGRGRRG